MLWHIVCYKIKNFMGLKELEVRPGENRIIQFTGRGAAGKSSAIKGLMYLLNGKYAIDEGVVAVNDQAEEADGELQIASRDGKQSYTIRRKLPAGKNARATETLYDDTAGRPVHMGPQGFLSDMFAGKITEDGKKNLKLVFDPLEFVKLNSPNQVQILHELMGVDSEKDGELDNEDRLLKKPIEQEVKILQNQLAGLPDVLADLPAKPIDTDAIQKKIAAASEENNKQQAVQQKKNQLGVEASEIGRQKLRNDQVISDQELKIADLERQLKLAKDGLKAAEQQRAALAKQHTAAEKAFQAAPDPVYVDVAALTMEITAAHRTNQAIRNRERHSDLGQQIEDKQAEAAKIEARIMERRRVREQAIQKAKLPITGIELRKTGVKNEKDVLEVYHDGLPLKQHSEGEQIRITVELLMALNPKLRAMFIQRGESLDENGYQVLEGLAEKYDFQIWMAKLDTSGAEGYVLEEGRLKTNNYAKKGARK